MEFKSSVENIDDVTRRIKVSVPADLITKEIKTEIDNLARRAQLKGFRQGKAPRQMVEKIYGEKVRLEVAQKLISTSLSKVTKENSIDMIGDPRIELSAHEAGKELEYTADVSIFPSPEIVGYESFEVKVPKAAVADKDIEEVFERLKKSKASIKKNDSRQVAQKGDVLDVLLAVEMPGESGVKAEPTVLVPGEGKFRPEVEEGIVGMNVGETREISAVVPQDHADENLRGKNANYKVTLQGVYDQVMPEINDDFAKSLDLEVSTIDELKAKIRTELEAQVENDAKAQAEIAILDQLVKKNEFQVPQILVDDEIRTMLARSGFFDPEKIDIQQIDVDPFRKEVGEAATKRVRSAIIVDRIGQKEGIKAVEEDLNQRIRELSEQSQMPEAEVRKYLQQQNRMLSVLVELSRTKVLKFLVERAKIEYTAKEDKAAKEAGSEGAEAKPEKKSKKKKATEESKEA